METKHTKTKLSYYDYEGSICIQLGPYCGDSDVLKYTNIGISKQEAEANAKLFCASHVLLETLQELMRFESSMRHVMAKELVSPDNFMKALTEAREAIKLATE